MTLQKYYLLALLILLSIKTALDVSFTLAGSVAVKLAASVTEAGSVVVELLGTVCVDTFSVLFCLF